MEILFLLIPLSVVLAVIIGAVFWLAVDGGQFDDLEGPGLRIVADDDTPGAGGRDPMCDTVQTRLPGPKEDRAEMTGPSLTVIKGLGAFLPKLP